MGLLLEASFILKPSEAMMVTPSRLLLGVCVAVFLFVSCHGVVDSSPSLEIGQLIVRDCMKQLEMHPFGSGLTREGFVSLINKLSNGQVGESFDRLPLAYNAAFNMNACMDGDGCVGDSATISISSQSKRNIICSSIASVVGESIPLTADNEGADSSSHSENSTTCDAEDEIVGKIV
jgi:hypothetical protein